MLTGVCLLKAEAAHCWDTQSECSEAVTTRKETESSILFVVCLQAGTTRPPALC